MCQEVKATRMKLGKLIEYNMRNIFLKKLYTKCGGEASSRPFYKKNINNLKCYMFCF